jgi:hypothetical protein
MNPTSTARRPADLRSDTTAIAVLSWSWAAAAVEPARAAVPTRWLAAHPADASLAAHLAGHLTCRF